MKLTSKQAASASLIIVFLALIRSIGEFFRLQYVQKSSLELETVKPFMISAMVCAVSLFIMNILFFYSKFKIITAVAIVAIAVLFWIKFYYQIK